MKHDELRQSIFKTHLCANGSFTGCIVHYFATAFFASAMTASNAGFG